MRSVLRIVPRGSLNVQYGSRTRYVRAEYVTATVHFARTVLRSVTSPAEDRGRGLVSRSRFLRVPIFLDLVIVMDVVLVSVEYHLVPEYPFPAALDDCDAALQYTIENAEPLGGDSDRICVELGERREYKGVEWEQFVDGGISDRKSAEQFWEWYLHPTLPSFSSLSTTPNEISINPSSSSEEEISNLPPI
ncbi:uncharacterized protein BDR25DRAFT_361248 [Lindgomyces ingoldianus]|uniref:Uncharacterized protein n=1 Tax=Lindgomyces ingoldianus TaxID=673940 RepID=A0ACB6QCQ8_9PLEO|nr:uncharacterized protein BDR25DRAFT_361248 [Lindgomyces ingoldianus]KAF2464701.1 hypothetical protein BDR25DRAFT_361248 [Lindgomyces ingoldianus]